MSSTSRQKQYLRQQLATLWGPPLDTRLQYPLLEVLCARALKSSELFWSINPKYFCVCVRCPLSENHSMWWYFRHGNCGHCICSHDKNLVCSHFPHLVPGQNHKKTDLSCPGIFVPACDTALVHFWNLCTFSAMLRYCWSHTSQKESTILPAVDHLLPFWHMTLNSWWEVWIIV